MSKGIIYLAPGQHQEVIDGITKLDYRVIVDSGLQVDGSFGTPFMKKVLFELKAVPRDLVSSIRASGRMSRQSIALGANDGPSFFFQVGYPEFAWQYDKVTGRRTLEMIDPEAKGHHRYTGLTYGEYQLRMLTMVMIGVLPMHIPSWDEVPETVCEFYKQFQQQSHTSHLLRPNFAGANIMESWPKPNAGALINHIFQGFESIGLKKADDLWKEFGTLRMFAMAGPEWYQKVPGIGKIGARS